MQARLVPWFVFVAAVLSLAMPATAVADPIGPGGFTNPVVIDFDSIPSSIFLSPVRPNPFAAQGVLFTGFTFQPGYPPPFSGNGLVAIVVGADQLPGIVRAEFLPSAGPVFRVNADVVPGFNVAPTLTAYDSSGAVIEMITGQTSTTFPQLYFLGLETTTAIARVDFSQAPTSVTTFPNIDNFRFEATPAVIPEPSAFALVTIGAVVLLGFGWKRRASYQGDAHDACFPWCCSTMRFAKSSNSPGRIGA